MSDMRQSTTLQELAFRYRHDQTLTYVDKQALLRTIGLMAVDVLTEDYESAQEQP